MNSWICMRYLETISIMLHGNLKHLDNGMQMPSSNSGSFEIYFVKLIFGYLHFSCIK